LGFGVENFLKKNAFFIAVFGVIFSKSLREKIERFN